MYSDQIIGLIGQMQAGNVLLLVTGVTYSVYFCMTVSITIFDRVLQLFIFILYFPHRDVQLVGIVT